MADPIENGLIDTSVVIDLGVVSQDKLPLRLAVSAVTLAELDAGPAAAGDSDICSTVQTAYYVLVT